MSVMIANKELISNVAEYIEKALNMRENHLELVLPEPDGDLVRELWQCRHIGFYSSRRIYEKLYQLNILSYNSAYGVEKIYIPEYEESKNYKRMKFISHEQICVNDEFIHFVKQLEFLIYNSDFRVGKDEISKSKNGRLYDALKNYLHKCYAFIVNNMDSYLKYEWGEFSISNN